MASIFKTIGLFGKYKDPSVNDAVSGLAEYLKYRGVEVVVGETTADEIMVGKSHKALSEPDRERLDLAIVIGGDGTMLHVARSLAPYDTPLVGVNMGRLGFLTDIPLDEMYEDVGRILDGEYKTEQRMLLEVEVWKRDKLAKRDTALNDMVIGKGELERLIELRIYVDGEFVTSVRCDGIIVATPTGSTAYALSAGGPIMHPQLAALILVPVCPHTLSMRPIALKDSSVLDFVLADDCADRAHISFDGQIGYHFSGDEKVRVKRSDSTVKLVRTLENNHYAALRSKLGWGDPI
ncbi:MAG: NAD(+) kinase [Arenicellales bacterium]